MPFKIVPFHSNAPLPLPFPLLEALFKGCLWYHLQIICCISDDVIHCSKYFFFKGNFEFREEKNVGRGGAGCGRVGIGCFAKNCLIDDAV
jgi:hypothetical protein